MVTHSVANLDLCDRLLVLVPGGKVAFFGPPRDGLQHFGKPGWAEVFQAFDAEPDRDWAGRVPAVPATTRSTSPPAMNAAAAVGRPRGSAAPPPRARNRLGQLSTLVRRYLAVIASDRVYLGVPGRAAARPGHDPACRSPSSAGAGRAPAPTPTRSRAADPGHRRLLHRRANSVREIVKERSIYTRERAAGLSAGAYLWSKLLVLGVISAVQAALMIVIGLIGRPLPPHGRCSGALPLVEIVLAMARARDRVDDDLGLLISAVVSTSEKTLPLLFVTVMVQVVLTGGVIPIAREDRGSSSSPGYPRPGGALARSASTANLDVIAPGHEAAIRCGRTRAHLADWTWA